MKRHIFLLSLLFFSISFADFARSQSAASFYLEPSAGSFRVGKTFDVSLYINTAQNSINAVEAEILFPADKLQVVSPSGGVSVIQIWPSPPKYSNTEGRVLFQGAIPSPGLATSGGLVARITFRVKSAGRATIRVADSSRMLLNDGKGTELLASRGVSVVQLNPPPPNGPVVVSPSHPEQGSWYKSASPIFEWADDQDHAEGYSYSLSADSDEEPDDVSEGLQTRAVFHDLGDGIYYFHIKALANGSWGETTHFQVNIDKTPPAKFTLEVLPDTKLRAGEKPIVYFETTDDLSGIDYYEVKVVPQKQAMFIRETAQFQQLFTEARSPFVMDLDDGEYVVIARAHDKAGNITESRQNIQVSLANFLVNRGVVISIGGEQIHVRTGLAWLVLFFILSLIGLGFRSVLKKPKKVQGQSNQNIGA